MERQRTLKNPTQIKGIGLHTGKHITLTFKPAPPNTGIVFSRIDLEGRPFIKADVDHLLDISRSPRRTSIREKGVEVHTIEHLMAVLSILQIDNLIIEIDNDEVPGLDGSGYNFWNVLKEAGVQEQEAGRNHYFIKEPLGVEANGAILVVLPATDLRISYTLSYNHPSLEAQYLDLNINQEIFEKEIVSARTFCLEEEADELMRQGLGKGANYENTLVVGKNGVIKNKLRFKDEFARHKILDLIGDLYLLGRPLRAHIIAIKSGHPLNIRLLKKIKEQKQRYELGAVKSEVNLSSKSLDASMIMRILPHRYPFLLVDKVISLEEGKAAIGIKNVTINDHFFQGHFPGRPVMPGVLIIEAMAQVGGVLMLAPEENRGKLAYFLACNNVKFRKTVVPGDQLVIKVEVVKLRSKTGQVHTQALVEGKIVAEADLMFALVEG